MKLYHIDTTGSLKCGELNLSNNAYYKMDDTITKMFKNNSNLYHKNGLSMHGKKYYSSEINNVSAVVDTIFEYERLLNFPEKL